MLGAIAGDVIGSVYERYQIKTTDFPLFHQNCRFTDDTAMTIAVASAILERDHRQHRTSPTNENLSAARPAKSRDSGEPVEWVGGQPSVVDYAASLKAFGRKYPHAGYGGTFINWIFQAEVQPYNSWGNGSAMRVSPIGFAFEDIETVLAEAERSAEVSHNHPEGIKGAQATALAVYLARHGESKEVIRAEISQRFGYNLNRTVEEIRPAYHFDVSCQGSVPEAIIAFLDSENYEDAVRKAISLGGDSDTLACIAGGIAQAHYQEIPLEIINKVRSLLPEEFLQIIDKFNQTYHL